MSWRGMLRAGTALAGVSVASALASGAWAQSATPGSVIQLEAVAVEGKVQDDAARKLEAIPGGVSLVTADQLEGKANVTTGDALAGVPGVVVQNFFGGNDQPRIQIRGSGLQQNPVQRGILVLQDGLPINQADGSYIVGLANPRGADNIEIYRGYTANRLGATVLGGALNFTSPTGSTAPGVEVGIEAGSFGQFNTSAQAGAKSGEVDGLAQISTSRRSGYRDYNDSERVTFDVNGGARLNDAVTTRFFAGYTDLEFDVSGPLPKSLLESRPRSVYAGPGTGLGAGPNVIRDLPQREATQLRLGNRTSATLGAHVIDAALGYTYTDDEFRYPISAGVQATDSNDVNLVLRYAYSPDASQPLPLFESSLRYAIGKAEREYYINRKGSTGALFGRNDLDSSTLSVNAGMNLPLAQDVTLSPSLTLARASRDNDDTYGAATRPTYNAVNGASGSQTAKDTSYSRDYTGFSPALGLSWRPQQDHMLFGAISRTFEPPTHDDLLATNGGTPNTSATGFVTPDLDAQTGTTVETGWRGKMGKVGIDAGTYYSWLKNEILSLRDASGVSLGAMNAEETRHFGIELGGSAQILDDLGLRLAYTYQDFSFHNDPVRGNNQLAGAPRHLINAVAHYDATADLWFETEVKWSPSKIPVDNMNTLYADPYATVSLRTSYGLTDSIRLYGEARNIFDETYASSTLVVDQAQATQAAFIPGDGRAFYAGVKAKF